MQLMLLQLLDPGIEPADSCEHLVMLDLEPCSLNQRILDLLSLHVDIRLEQLDLSLIHL